jgi:hypothetical protein
MKAIDFLEQEYPFTKKMMDQKRCLGSFDVAFIMEKYASHILNELQLQGSKEKAK